MREKSLTYDRLSEHKDEIAQSVLPELSKMFEEDYGLKMFSFTAASSTAEALKPPVAALSK